MANTKKSSIKKKIINFLSIIKISIGPLLIVIGCGILVYNSYSKVFPIKFEKKTEQVIVSQNTAVSKPTKIYIPKLHRVLNVSDGYFQDNRWATSQTGVSYLTSTPLPGVLGNSVIYGHNTKDILGGLWRVNSGDPIYVIMSDGNFLKYQVSETKEIHPTQVEILKNTSDKRLTIYTCSGFLDSARFVVTAIETAS